MAESKLRIVIEAQDRATGTIDKTVRGVSELDKRTKSATDRIKEFSAGVLGATAILIGIGVAAKKAFDFARRGAEIQLAEDRFRRLSDEMGISNQFLDDMRTSTRGVRSEFDLMSAATDIMALGLVKNEDQLRRLVTVGGELGFD